MRQLLGAAWLERQRRNVGARMRAVAEAAFGKLCEDVAADDAETRARVAEGCAVLRALELADVALRKGAADAVMARLWSAKQVRLAHQTLEEREGERERKAAAKRQWREEVGGSSDDDGSDDGESDDDVFEDGIGSCGGARDRLSAVCEPIFGGRAA